MGVGEKARRGGVRTSPPAERAASTQHARLTRPRASVVIATCDREPFLAELVSALEAQTADDFEVVIVDDGSSDETWRRLAALAGTTTLPLLALRIASTGGPSVPRNTGVAHARADVLLFTDDDCLPEPEWTASVLDAIEAGASLVRGPVRPVEGPHGAWDRSIDVAGPTPWFETSNICYRRALFDEAGGFPVLDVLGRLPRARGFGEDVVLGHRAAARTTPVWAAGATVRHRWLPGTFRDHLAGRRRLVGFPALRRELPALRESLACGVFLNDRSAAFDLAVVGTAAALIVRRPMPLLAALPWVRRAWPDARRRGHGRAPLRLAQLAVADAVGAAALAQGSVRSRVPVL
jgi:glycosyltransferase involved in cell wall biosynthesis